jgi:cell filamentation protein
LGRARPCANRTPDIAVSKGSVLFAHPADAKPAVDHALRIGQDKIQMADKPGEVMGYLAYGHPFLDGNGRTIMVVHTELAQRAGISIDWAATDKTAYLAALTQELNRPGKGHLDSYLKPFVGPAIGRNRLASHVARAPGIDGKGALITNEVLGTFSDPALRARYRHQERQRHGETDDSEP